MRRRLSLETCIDSHIQYQDAAVSDIEALDNALDEIDHNDDTQGIPEQGPDTLRFMRVRSYHHNTTLYKKHERRL